MTEAGPYPACPTCDSTTARCRWPDGAPTIWWHRTRVDQLRAMPYEDLQCIARIVPNPHVKAVPDPTRPGSWTIVCEHCRDDYTSTNQADVDWHAERHRIAHRAGLLDVSG